MKLRQNPSRYIQAFQLQYKGGVFGPKVRFRSVCYHLLSCHSQPKQVSIQKLFELTFQWLSVKR